MGAIGEGNSDSFVLSGLEIQVGYRRFAFSAKIELHPRNGTRQCYSYYSECKNRTLCTLHQTVIPDDLWV